MAETSNDYDVLIWADLASLTRLLQASVLIDIFESAGVSYRISMSRALGAPKPFGDALWLDARSLGSPKVVIALGRYGAPLAAATDAFKVLMAEAAWFPIDDAAIANSDADLVLCSSAADQEAFARLLPNVTSKVLPWPGLSKRSMQAGQPPEGTIRVFFAEDDTVRDARVNRLRVLDALTRVRNSSLEVFAWFSSPLEPAQELMLMKLPFKVHVAAGSSRVAEARAFRDICAARIHAGLGEAAGLAECGALRSGMMPILVGCDSQSNGAWDPGELAARLEALCPDMLETREAAIEEARSTAINNAAAFESAIHDILRAQSLPGLSIGGPLLRDARASGRPVELIDVYLMIEDDAQYLRETIDSLQKACRESPWRSRVVVVGQSPTQLSMTEMRDRIPDADFLLVNKAMSPTALWNMVIEHQHCAYDVAARRADLVMLLTAGVVINDPGTFFEKVVDVLDDAVPRHSRGVLSGLYDPSHPPFTVLRHRNMPVFGTHSVDSRHVVMPTKLLHQLGKMPWNARGDIGEWIAKRSQQATQRRGKTNLVVADMCTDMRRSMMPDAESAGLDALVSRGSLAGLSLSE